MTNERLPRTGSLVRRVLSLGGGGTLLLLFVVALALGAPFCPSAGFLGVPCPGCGLTRATLSLLSGDLRGALALHPLVLVVTPAVAALLGYAAYRLLARGAARRASKRVSSMLTTSACVLVVALIAVWLARFAGSFGGPVPVTTYAEWLGTLRR